MILTVMARRICKPSKQQMVSPDCTKSTIFCNSALSYWCRFVEMVLNRKADWNLPMIPSVARMKSLSVRRQLLTESDLTENVAVRTKMMNTNTNITNPTQAQTFRNMVLTFSIQSCGPQWLSEMVFVFNILYLVVGRVLIFYGEPLVL